MVVLIYVIFIVKIHLHTHAPVIPPKSSYLIATSS